MVAHLLTASRAPGSALDNKLLKMRQIAWDYFGGHLLW